MNFLNNTLIADKSKFLGVELFNDINQTISEDIYANPDALTLDTSFMTVEEVVTKVIEIINAKLAEKGING